MIASTIVSAHSTNLLSLVKLTFIILLSKYLVAIVFIYQIHHNFFEYTPQIFKIEWFPGKTFFIPNK